MCRWKMVQRQRDKWRRVYAEAGGNGGREWSRIEREEWDIAINELEFECPGNDEDALEVAKVLSARGEGGVGEANGRP